MNWAHNLFTQKNCSTIIFLVPIIFDFVKEILGNFGGVLSSKSVNFYIGIVLSSHIGDAMFKVPL